MSESPLLHIVRDHPLPVVVEFWAPWCLPCRTVEPTIRQLEAEYGGRVEVFRIDADEDPESARALGVRGIPTLITFQGGQEVARRTGSAPKSTLRELFEVGLAAEASVTRVRPVGLAAPAPADRLLRALTAAALPLLGWIWGPSPLLILLGGLFLFSAVYDRCPLWRALARRPRSPHRRKQR